MEHSLWTAIPLDWTPATPQRFTSRLKIITVQLHRIVFLDSSEVATAVQHGNQLLLVPMDTLPVHSRAPSERSLLEQRQTESYVQPTKECLGSASEALGMS